MKIHKAFFHKRYDLGTKDHGIDNSKYNSFQEMEENEFELDDVYRPVYMIDHSGLSFSTTPFHCPWDSGQIGFIYARASDIQKRYGSVDKRTKLLVASILLEEVELMNEEDI